MDTNAVATRFYTLLQRGEYEAIREELFSPSIQSTEHWDGGLPSFVGMATAHPDGNTWTYDLVAVHNIEVSEPLVATHSFAILCTQEVTLKTAGRTTLTELSVYTVEKGLIVRNDLFM